MEVSIGRQIRRLREAAGLKAADLADALGVDASAVSNLEHDRRNVKAAELAAIASFLGVSQLAILEPDSLLGRLPVAHRTNGDATASQDSLMRLTALAELHQVLDEGGHPTPPRTGEPPPRLSGWLRQANALADWAQQRLAPTASGEDRLTELATAIEAKLCVDVMVESLGEDGPLGLCITDSAFSFILVNADQLRSRALFTLAHELGHVLNSDGTTINIDRDLRARSDEERLANAFAAAFLMPEPKIRETISKYGRQAESLARMLVGFGVSYETLIYRLHNLGIINAEGRARLKRIRWASLIGHLDDDETARNLLAARGARPERRPPTLLASRCLHGALDGIVSAGPLARLLDVEIDKMIEALNSIGPEAAETIDGDFSAPEDPPDVTIQSFDEDPVAA
ncbi:MAG: XRE family transcriptional regulator [Acidimicrobiaceae bacterium]|nr:XRE family transcriptional regulator [Acidimicrobiaceae bacterium]